jgi:hypothetical protein
MQNKPWSLIHHRAWTLIHHRAWREGRRDERRPARRFEIMCRIEGAHGAGIARTSLPGSKYVIVLSLDTLLGRKKEKAPSLPLMAWPVSWCSAPKPRPRSPRMKKE